MIIRTVKVKIFWYFEILNFRSDDVTILRNVRNGHFGRKARKRHNNDSCADEDNEDCDKKPKRETEVTETDPSCNYCVATIAARQLLTVRGGEQPSGLQRNQV